MKSTIFFVILTVFMLILVGNLLRSRKIRERYAVLWVAVGLFMLILVAFPDLLAWFAGLVGVAVPSNLLFALAIIRLLGITLQLTLEVSRAEDRSRVLAEHVSSLLAQWHAWSAGQSVVYGFPTVSSACRSARASRPLAAVTGL